MDEDDRRSVLVSLLELDRPLVELQATLKGLEWDYPNALVTLTRDHIQHVLERFKAGTLQAVTIEAWANHIELRDDIEHADETTKEAIHALANPILNGPLNDDAVEQLLIQIPN